MPDTFIACYCGRPRTYTQCCQPLHLGLAVATTAEQLMRSRYSAFCAYQFDYLMATSDPALHQPNELQALIESCRQQQWVHLDIQRTRRGGQYDTHGEVEFVAWHIPRSEHHNPLKIEHGLLLQLHERSQFEKVGGRWLYVNGDILPPLAVAQPPIARNSPCWCGSQRKFKHCHG